jgi:hypothetical protein
MYNEIGVLFRIFMNDQNKRLNILTAKEIQALYGIPQFTPEERITYFTLDPVEEYSLHKCSRLFYSPIRLFQGKKAILFF